MFLEGEQRVPFDRTSKMQSIFEAHQTLFGVPFPKFVTSLQAAQTSLRSFAGLHALRSLMLVTSLQGFEP